MAYEYQIKFAKQDWYKENIENIKNFITNLPSFKKKVSDNELWLRDGTSMGSWEYDIRIFFLDNMLIEVSMASSAFTRDIKKLAQYLSSETEIKFVNDDEEDFSFN
jgi:hypothetical protein